MTERDTPYGPEPLLRAFELAEKGRGRTYPNPMVGAVIVKNGRVVGEGWHPRIGGPHAEIAALNEAGDQAAGADIYVSLEPCCRQGRTPPCTTALIDAGIRRVTIGALDPNPLMNGQGVEILRRAGIDVVIAEIPAEYARQNEVYVKYITRREPFLLLKSAISINGMISAVAGAQTQLTGDEVRSKVHAWRNEYPMVAIGAETALIDDPLLTCRLENSELRQPIRLVIDSHGRLPLTSRLVQTVGEAPVWLAAVEGMKAEKRRGLEKAGVEILTCAENNGRVDLRDLLRQLGEREIAALMVEGGARLNEALLAGGLVDKLVVFMAPSVLSGPNTVSMTAGEAVFSREFKIASSRLMGADLMIEAYPAEEEQCFQES